MLERLGVGTDTAGALLVAAGENSDRIRNERSFARLCGAAPLDASSGKQQRHRLSRAGDRQANSALWRIVITRLSYDPAARATSNAAAPKAKPKPKPSDASSATSHASSTPASPRTNWLDAT
jgi:transposase